MIAAWIETTGIVIASGVAIWGIAGWRKQMVAERKMNLAEEVLSAFYQAKAIIEAARDPNVWGGEGRGWREEGGDVELRPEAVQIDAYHAPLERLNKHAEFFSKFDALQFRSQAVFGDPVVDHFAAIRKVQNQVRFASSQLAYRLYEHVHENAPRMDEKLEKELKSEIGLGLTDIERESHHISQTVAAAVKGIESVCRPALDESLSLWPWKRPKWLWPH